MTTQVGAVHDADDGTVLVKLRESPFYPKGGGQVADSGWIESDSARAAVEDVVRCDDDQVIVARLEHGELHPASAFAPTSTSRPAGRRWPTTPRFTCCTPPSAAGSATT